MPADAALVAFCDDQHSRLVGMLALYVGDRHVAEELAQDTLVRLCRDWDDVARMESPVGWVTTVAFNLARSWWRRQYARGRAHQRHGGAPEAVDPHDSETVMVVRAAIAELPPRQREVIVLRYLADLPVADTAEVMGCAPGTVKSLTSRAMDSLRRHDVGLAEATGRATEADRDPPRQSPLRTSTTPTGRMP